MSDWCDLVSEWRSLKGDVERLLEEVQGLEHSQDVDLLTVKTNLLTDSMETMGLLITKLHALTQKSLSEE